MKNNSFRITKVIENQIYTITVDLKDETRPWLTASIDIPASDAVRRAYYTGRRVSIELRPIK